MILVIDDDTAIRTTLQMMLRRAHYEVETAATPAEAMQIVRRQTPRLIMLDMNFSLSTSGDEGLTLLRQIKLFRPAVPVILMTAWGSIQLAVEGMRAGATDFVTKPWNYSVMMERIETALQATAPATHAGEPGQTGPQPGQETPGTASCPAFSGIIGRSAALLSVLDTVRRVAPTNAPVLILGESGTGKELIAEALHRLSRRSKEPFVKVNLGGISQTLFESEMFGHRKGAFTGALTDRAGRFELADKGTIFLDELGELDIASQVKLLRVLQDQTYEPLGDSRQRRVNVRVISATNADLPALISEGRFREDLYYRVNLITLRLPALRERREDIPLLADHFIRLQCQANGMAPVTMSPEALAALREMPFPGNIRQLKNVVDRAVIMCEGGVIKAKDVAAGQTEPAPHTLSAASSALNLEERERAAILRAMDECGGNISRMAEALGLSRAALYRRMEKFGIKR